MDSNAALQYGDPAGAAMNGALGQYRQAIQKQQAAQQPAFDKFTAAAAAPRPDVPKPETVGEAPKQEDFQKQASGWVNAMALFSALVGAKSRQHATTALKAFAGGVQGMQKGNQQEFENAYKTWEGDTKAALDNNRAQLEQYDTIMKNRELTENEAFNEMKMIGYQHQDELMMQAENYHQMASIYDAKLKAELNASALTNSLKIWKEKQDFKSDEKLTPSISQEAADFAADQLLAGDKSGLSNYGRGEKATANLALIHQTVQQRAADRGITGDQLAKINAQFAGQTSEARAIGTASGKIRLAANSLDESLPLLEDAIKKIDMTQFYDLNSLDNYAKLHSGNPNIVTLNTALQTTVSDYSTLIARNGQRTDATDAAAKHLANTSMSKGQLQAFIDQVRRERDAQLRATKRTKEGEEGEADAPPSSPTAGDAPDYSNLWSQ